MASELSTDQRFIKNGLILDTVALPHWGEGDYTNSKFINSSSAWKYARRNASKLGNDADGSRLNAS